jgi:hypothetical protein
MPGRCAVTRKLARSASPVSSCFSEQLVTEHRSRTLRGRRASRARPRPCFVATAIPEVVSRVLGGSRLCWMRLCQLQQWCYTGDGRPCLTSPSPGRGRPSERFLPRPLRRV